MYSNGVRVDEVDRLNREGILTRPAGGRGPCRQTDVPGQQVFRAQCQMCHSLDGYLAIRPLVAGQDAEGLTAFLEALRAGRPGMPPVVGTEEEIKALAEYLVSLLGATRKSRSDRFGPPKGRSWEVRNESPAIPRWTHTLPAPAWLFQALLLVTFFIHILFLNATLGGR